MSALPTGAYAAALAALPGCGPARLTALLSCTTPEDAWAAVCRGHALNLPGVAETLGSAGRNLAALWRHAAAASDPATTWDAIQEMGVRVSLPGDAAYPRDLEADTERPPVLFATGLAIPVRPRVAIIGTRRSTYYGRTFARELGHDLTTAGVSVVSGLAVGIDGAAHEGALSSASDAPPIAVVGSGLDVIYPARHKDLWRRVASGGVIISESPMGAAPEPWRFPLRNRIIAALADILVVVESHPKGGSMLTVQAALERGITVMAVPGSVRSDASSGTNRLLGDGMPPVLDAGDVLVALSLDSSSWAPTREPQPQVEAEDKPVLEVIGWEPTATEEILRRTGRSIGAVALSLARLEAAGAVAGVGGWWQRAGERRTGIDGHPS